MRFISMASSSKGNAALVQAGDDWWLLDCGISTKKMIAVLGSEASLLASVTGVIITHEHRDHIGGLGPFLRRFQKPCYASAETARRLLDGRLGKGVEGLIRPLPPEGLRRKEGRVRPIALSHDAAAPIGYHIEAAGERLTMITDTGIVSDEMRDFLARSDIMVLEANHDRTMLREGPYPESLKRRIAGDQGHLANEVCAATLAETVSDGTKHVVLAHLSENNNTPEHALGAVLRGVTLPRTTRLHVARPVGALAVTWKRTEETDNE